MASQGGALGGSPPMAAVGTKVAEDTTIVAAVGKPGQSPQVVQEDQGKEDQGKEDMILVPGRRRLVIRTACTATSKRTKKSPCLVAGQANSRVLMSLVCVS